uniref:glutathione-specific gamma-glutamylcyclotransferase n=1 Tax=Chlamydomonas euryale TaxID=1486919 RepID=A0A7R9V6M3_9CHLO|mmetsp:Transcript_22943/g.68206  ORF Transcript_22943/g.68206 Transcript_22943/m.68206 type:complete len:238 (+) Transcript_22943:325-1038(+)
MAAKSIWIFGYGSIIWKAGFPHRKKLYGFIKGYRRVWWQGSTDHRGTPEAPGRTLTLAEDPDAYTWGAAYELDGTFEEQQKTLEYLEWREKQYDIRRQVDLLSLPNVTNGTASLSASVDEELPDPQVLVSGASLLDKAACIASQREPSKEPEVLVKDCLVYIAGPDKTRNPNYLGPASIEDIAHQIAMSVGPSGPNCEYLFGIAQYLRDKGIVDEEMFEMERIVRDIVAKRVSEKIT